MTDRTTRACSVRTFRTVVEAHVERDGQRIDFEQPLIVRYRALTGEGRCCCDGDIDFETVERDTRGEYWDSRVTKDYWVSLTDADWQRLTDEAWEDFHGQ